MDVGRLLAPVGRGGRGIVGGWKGENVLVGLEGAGLVEGDTVVGIKGELSGETAKVAGPLSFLPDDDPVGERRGTKKAPTGLDGLAGPGTSRPRKEVPQPIPARPAFSFPAVPPVKILSSDEDVTRRLRGICFLFSLCFGDDAGPTPSSVLDPWTAETGEGSGREAVAFEREECEGDGGAG